MALQDKLTSAEGGNPWKSYDQWIEVDADQAAYTAASPENALVLLGANRKPTGNNLAGLKPIGLLQNLTIGQNINWTAQQMIGSARTFFLAGKSPGNGTISRLFTSSSTMLGALYQVVLANHPELSAQLESPAYQKNPKIMFTMDTELLKIPVGMACLFRDTAKNFIGGFYIEHMVFQNLSLGFSVGQPAIMESVQVMFDRVVPFDVFSGVEGSTNVKTEFDAAVIGQ